ncbi:hypothetical protein [Kamptonema formosum]|uniref:hypothetical protein n=1 Tax=Kamptonema formosum TaxID=331992 RepID=UPI0012DE773F|nr:hypothetical protein [Oscillatoria sp. PCC 10802]
MWDCARNPGLNFTSFDSAGVNFFRRRTSGLIIPPSALALTIAFQRIWGWGEGNKAGTLPHRQRNAEALPLNGGDWVWGVGRGA